MSRSFSSFTPLPCHTCFASRKCWRLSRINFNVEETVTLQLHSTTAMALKQYTYSETLVCQCLLHIVSKCSSDIEMLWLCLNVLSVATFHSLHFSFVSYEIAILRFVFSGLYENVISALCVPLTARPHQKNVDMGWLWKPLIMTHIYVSC